LALPVPPFQPAAQFGSTLLQTFQWAPSVLRSCCLAPAVSACAKAEAA
jgi:hypothetical protein